jgi:hypothetical protein
MSASLRPIRTKCRFNPDIKAIGSELFDEGIHDALSLGGSGGHTHSGSFLFRLGGWLIPLI